jgi:hypothetical protein
MIIDDDDLQNAIAASRIAQGSPPIAEDPAALRVLAEIVERALALPGATAVDPVRGAREVPRSLNSLVERKFAHVSPFRSRVRYRVFSVLVVRATGVAPGR